MNINVIPHNKKTFNNHAWCTKLSWQGQGKCKVQQSRKVSVCKSMDCIVRNMTLIVPCTLCQTWPIVRFRMERQGMQIGYAAKASSPTTAAACHSATPAHQRSAGASSAPDSPAAGPLSGAGGGCTAFRRAAVPAHNSIWASAGSKGSLKSTTDTSMPGV